MQPTFLPWVGYFNLFSKVDHFVFLDDVQFDRRSWQVRNRILLGGQEFLISLPTQKAARDTNINEIVPSIDRVWIDKTMRSLQHAYNKTPYGVEVIELVSKHLQQPCGDLASFNISLIGALSKRIGLEISTTRSQDLPHDGIRSDRLLSICKALDCDSYLSPIGSRDYLMEDGAFENSGVELQFSNHQPVPYAQANTGVFVPYMSIVDLLANVGPDSALQYIKDVE